MSEENKNIDQLFSDAAHSEAAPQYDPAYWAEMNTMLNARDAKKRAFIFWALGGSAAFAVLFLSLFTLNTDNSLEKERYVKEEMNINFNDKNSADNKALAFDNAENDLKKNSKSSIKTDENIENRTKEKQKSERSSKNEFVNQKSTLIYTERNQGLTEKENQGLKNAIKNNGNKLVAFETIDSNSKNHRDQNSNSAAENNNFKNKVEHSDVTSLESNSNELVNNSDKSIAGNSIIVLPFASNYHITQKNPENITLSTLELKSNPKYRFYAKLSGGLMENYKTSRPYESGLFDLSLNLEIDMNNVLFRTGLGSQLTTNADLIVSQRKVINDIIVVNLQKDLSYQNLVDIYIPLELGYQLNKTSFGVGAQVNYLLTTSMDLNNYENKKLVNTEKQYGNRDGLNSFTTQGYVWIEQRFSPMISLGLKAGTNISGRIKDGAYFNQSATTNPIYGQLSLRVNLIK